MIDRLTEALKKSTADYAEVRFETDDTTSIGFRGAELDQLSSDRSAGGIVRACTRGGWGAAKFDSPDELDHQVAEACRCAALVGRETTQLAQTDPPREVEVRAHLERDFRGVSLDDRLALAAAYNEIILKADPAIETTRVGYEDEFRTVYFASTHGASFVEERPRVMVGLAGVARDGPMVQRGFDSVASATTYDAVTGLEERARGAARRAVDLLTAPSCPGGPTTVVLDPQLAGVFVHEAFGHLSEADFLYENPKMRDLMHLGREMGVKQLNVVDDGSMPGVLGTHSFDDEGTPTHKTYLIKEGVLAGHLHSLETAGKMNEPATGNARAIGRGWAPIVRMTNTYVEGGDQTFDDVLAGVDRGIYACAMMGGQTMMEMFTFSAAYGYRIENGQLGELVRDVVLTGNVFQTLHAIDAFGDDFQVIQRGGGCGKGGQSPLPVTFGAPHIRIRDVVVGGQEGGAS